MRVCPKCNCGTSFAKNQAYCKECNKAYREAHSRERKDYQLKRRYGLSLDEYEQRLRDQQGCEICGKVCSTGKHLAVDHNHQTGTVRGLLCGRCNRGIGYFEDDTTLLEKAIDYLRKYK